MTEESNLQEASPEKREKIEKISSPEKVEQTIERPLEKKGIEGKNLPKIALDFEELKSITKTKPQKKKTTTDKNKDLVNDLISIVIKNPDTEKGLVQASKEFNREIKKRKIKEGEFSYLIDEFHDSLLKKLREREQKFKNN